MANESTGSDLGVGVGAVLSVIAVLAAAGMALVDPTATTASGMHVASVPFALALTAGVAAVAAIHLFWSQ